MTNSDKRIDAIVKPGAWLSLGNPVIAELAASYPFAWILFDLEHGYGTEATLLSNFQAAKREGLALIVRIGKFDPALIARVLDWGAAGIMLPHTDSPKQATACISAMRYPPHGTRGYSSSSRCFEFGNAESRKMPLFFAQIESEEAVKNVAAIAAVDGVDVLFTGPADLRLDLESKKSPSVTFNESIEKIAVAAKLAGKQAGIITKSTDDFKRYAKTGYTYISYASDLLFLREGFRKVYEFENLEYE